MTIFSNIYIPKAFVNITGVIGDIKKRKIYLLNNHYIGFVFMTIHGCWYTEKKWLQKLTAGHDILRIYTEKTDMVLYTPHNIYSALFYLISQKNNIYTKVADSARDTYSRFNLI